MPETRLTPYLFYVKRTWITKDIPFLFSAPASAEGKTFQEKGGGKEVMGGYRRL
jgi:hypothetical protein